MNYNKYLSEKKELYDMLIQYIEIENDDYDYYLNLMNIINDQKILENKEEIELFLHLIIQISNNHHRQAGFFTKIQKVFRHFLFSIKNNFTNLEIFELCKSNKPITLYFIKNKVINIDEKIVQNILYRSIKTNSKYHLFFYPEIKEYLDLQEVNDINEVDLNSFEKNRDIGENEHYICELIRNDSIDEFITFITHKSFSLSSIIMPSIFETNSFLIKNEPTIIEYAAFFGSIQIIQFLKYNNVEMTPSLWIYAIHSKNPELIHLLEENDVEPPNGSFNTCFTEAIKCHHNDIADYIKTNLIYNEKCHYMEIFKYFNFCHVPSYAKNNSIFYFLCRYNYTKLIEFYIFSKGISMNYTSITEFLYIFLS